jgi:hypothetical protein
MPPLLERQLKTGRLFNRKHRDIRDAGSLPAA